jgi:hypothetical protein
MVQLKCRLPRAVFSRCVRTGALLVRRPEGFTHHNKGIGVAFITTEKTVHVKGTHCVRATRLRGQLDPLHGGRHIPRMGAGGPQADALRAHTQGDRPWELGAP